MISVNEAIQLIEKNTSLLPTVSISLHKACGFVLAKDVFARVNVPAFDQSAMDGYAFRFSDFLPNKAFTIAGEVAAGDAIHLPLQTLQAIRVFTGAAIPETLDTVVMQEKTEVRDNKLFINDDLLIKGSNVRLKGSEINENDLALAAGTVLTPAAIGFLASVGITEVVVYRQPRVHIIITGNELQPPGLPLQYGQAYESNSVMLRAALQQLRIDDCTVVHVKDDIEQVKQVLASALEAADLVLLTGGVSVGKYDFVVQAAEACGITQLFHKVKQRPGKPLYAGIRNNIMVFGLPGNPASVLTCFYNYVTMAIEKMSGRKNMPERKFLPLTVPVSKKISLTQFLKGRYTDTGVRPLAAQESYRLSSFSIANCLIVLPEEKMEFTEGEVVETIILPYL